MILKVFGNPGQEEESIKYQTIWETLDFMIFIKQDDFEHIVNNRWNQEVKNLRTLERNTRFPNKILENFVIISNLGHTLFGTVFPGIADITITCAPNYDYSWPKNRAIF